MQNTTTNVVQWESPATGIQRESPPMPPPSAPLIVCTNKKDAKDFQEWTSSTKTENIELYDTVVGHLSCWGLPVVDDGCLQKFDALQELDDGSLVKNKMQNCGCSFLFSSAPLDNLQRPLETEPELVGIKVPPPWQPQDHKVCKKRDSQG